MKIQQMKIISIGNSFSQDAQRWLKKLAEQNGIDLDCVNLFIGGCSLETHWNNIAGNKADYDFEPNGGKSMEKISVNDALSRDKYDIITLQQASSLSGRPQSYLPYLADIAAFAREMQPEARLYFHQTWAYETDSVHAAFADYDLDQKEMYRRIEDAGEMASKLIGAEIIPTGRIIQRLRETLPEFDYKNGGLSLNRDGFHLSLDYGRYAAAAVWLYTFTGCKIKAAEFENFDLNLLSKIIITVTG